MIPTTNQTKPTMTVSDRITIDSLSVVYGQESVTVENETAEITEMSDDLIVLELDNEDAVPAWANGEIQLTYEMIEYRDYDGLEALLEDIASGDAVGTI